MITGRRIPIAGTNVASQPLRCGPRSTPGVTRRARNRVAHVAVAARAEDQIESVDDDDGGSGGKGILGGDGDGDGAGSGHRWQEVATLAEDDDDDEEEEEDDDEEGDDLDDEDGIEEDEGDSEVSDPSVEEVDDDDDDDEEDPILKDKQGDFYVHSIRMEGLAVGEGIPTEHDISSMLITQPGFWGTKADLSKDLRQLTSLGLFKDVKANVKALKGGKMKGKFCVVFTFSENKWPKIKSFKLTGSKLLPADIVQGTKVMEMLPKDRPYTDLVTFAAIKKVVEGWYQRNGYAFNYITSYDGLETGNVVAKVMEPVVNKVELQFVDDNMQPIQGQKHEVNKDIVMRELPFKKGRCYNTADGRRALRDVFALNYFDNAQVLPEQNRKDPTKVDVTVMLKERPMKTVDFEAEWPVAAHQGKVWLPMPAALVPGGNMTYENRNLQKKGNTLSISINSSNLLRPADDLTFRAQYRRPYILGQNDEKKTALVVDAFNTRKISPVFSSNDSKDVPPIYIDRSGARIGLQETLSRNSKAYYGLVLQDVQAKDETGMLMPVGCKLGAGDQLVADGPPTTTSDSGVDRTLHLQAGLARDTTYWVKGTTVGARDLLAIDQGIGLGSLFNKVEASATRFIQLKKESSQGGSPPPVLVLSGSAGTAVGTLPAYEAFVLGGPHSSRGYPLGGLGAARSFAGLSAEVRQTIPVLKKQGYLFAETVADLGSSKLVRGNPTEYFRRAGRGSSYGAGVRFGPARLEYARDCNLGNGGLFVRFGERY